jgi:hypothetical protein
VDQLVNYGALGIMVAGFVAGFVVSKTTHDRVIAERDRAEAQRDAVLDDVLNRVAPALERATEAIKARESHDSEVYEVLVDVRRMLERRQL